MLVDCVVWESVGSGLCDVVVGNLVGDCVGDCAVVDSVGDCVRITVIYISETVCIGFVHYMSPIIRHSFNYFVVNDVLVMCWCCVGTLL